MPNLLSLSGRTILVTGASSGIGRQTAIQLSELGARIVLVGRSPERLQETAGRLRGEGHPVQPRDLAAVEDVPKWLKELCREIGPLNGLVHSAGVHLMKPLRFMSPQEFSDLMTVNVVAAAALLKGLRQKGVCGSPASAVLISSVMGMVGQAGVTGYCASKGALCALTRSSALELAEEGIRVNCVAPGWVQTEMADRAASTLTEEQMQQIRGMHPLGLGEPQDVAAAVAFLLSDAAKWITGSTLVVDGGYTAH
jgi:NAD(P)-dependent dehydrogenase (short-subunit alcohol dehydrogenase family)